jgi:hypothetical protein
LVLLSACFDGEVSGGPGSPEAPPTAFATPAALTATAPPAPQFSGPPTPAISTAPFPPGTNRWSVSAIWDPGVPTLAPLWQTHCGVANAAMVNPSNRGFDCVVEVMWAAGAHPEAIAFLKEYGYFLGSFEELGTVDFGRGQAPWFNMGRPQHVLLLNGIPANVELNDTLRLQFETVRTGKGQAASSYAGLLGQASPPIAWADRSFLASSEPRNGGQAITVYVAMQVGRANTPVGYMPVEFVISPSGVLGQASTLLPLRAP